MLRSDYNWQVHTKIKFTWQLQYKISLKPVRFQDETWGHKNEHNLPIMH
jgi:hypothetical protein